MTSPDASVAPARWWQRHRHMVLLLTLMLPVVVSPALAAEGYRPRWLKLLFFALVLGMALRTVVASRRQRLTLAAIALIALLAHGADYAAGHPLTVAVSQLAWAAWLIYLCTLLLHWALSDGQVTFERISAAICAYVCLALIWASFYNVLLVWRPEAMRFPPGMTVDESVLTYYSFVTLTTLGYGEIVPVHALARGLAYLEATVGPLYMAVLIARLVAMEIIHSQRGRTTTSPA